MKTLTVSLTTFVALATSTQFASAQSPIVGPQQLISVDQASNSGNETSFAANASGKDLVGGFNDWRPDGTIKSSFSVSSDGGATWGTLIVRPPINFQTSVEGDPMACYDKRTNTLWAGAMSFGGNGGIYIAKKTLGQNSFQPFVMARINGGVDKGWMAAGPKPGNPNSTRLYIAYNEGVIWSDDLGATFTNPNSFDFGLGFLPRVGPNGELYVTYWDDGFGVRFARSLDGGNTFTSVQAAGRLDSWGTESPNGRVPGTYRIPPIQTMAVNPVDGSIVIMYFDTTNTIGSNVNLDLYMVKSTDKGTTWSNPARLPFRPLNVIGDMFFPWIEFTADGRLHLSAYDTSYHVQNDGIDHGLIDEDYAYSDDEGATWAKYRITPVSYDSFNDGRNSFTSFLGDYEGIAITDHKVFTAYPDTQSGHARIYSNAVYNPIYRPESFGVVTGSLTGGTLKSLFFHDNDRMTIRAQPNGLDRRPPAQLEIDATSQVANPSTLQLYLWTSVSTAGIQLFTQLLNASSQKWETVDTRPAPVTDTNMSIPVPAAQKYIASNGKIRARLEYGLTGRQINGGWTATVSQSVFLIGP